MLDGKRVVVVTPAGRRRYMAILVRHVLRLCPVVDEYRVWVNTSVPEDIEYLESLPAQCPPGFLTIERLPPGASVRGNESICHFFRNCADENTVYVRFDDDIVFIDDLDAFTAFVRFRISNPEPFLVYANILNNAVISFIHQRVGTLGLGDYEVAYHCMESLGWTSPECAAALHAEVLPALETTKGLERFRLPGFEPVFADYERVSINCISWLGSDFASFGGEVGCDEELWLSCTKPAESGRPNAMFGGFVVVHFAFHTQRAHLESRGSRVLHRYAALAGIPESDIIFVETNPEPEPDPEPQIFGPRRRGMRHCIIEPSPASSACPDRMLELIARYKASQDKASQDKASQDKAAQDGARYTAANKGAT
jgi:hypothetical protein